MEVTLAVIADAANVSSDGKLNVLGRFSNIYAGALPARHPVMVLVLEIEADPFEAGTQKRIEVILADPDGVEMSKVAATVVLPQPTTPGPMRSLMIMDFRELEFRKAGPHSFKTIIDGVDSPRTTDLEVSLLPTGGQ